MEQFIESQQRSSQDNPLEIAMSKPRFGIKDSIYKRLKKIMKKTGLETINAAVTLLLDRYVYITMWEINLD